MALTGILSPVFADRASSPWWEKTRPVELAIFPWEVVKGGSAVGLPPKEYTDNQIGRAFSFVLDDHPMIQVRYAPYVVGNRAADSMKGFDPKVTWRGSLRDKPNLEQDVLLGAQLGADIVFIGQIRYKDSVTVNNAGSNHRVLAALLDVRRGSILVATTLYVEDLTAQALSEVVSRVMSRWRTLYDSLP